MKVERLYAYDVFKDNNKGFLYGLQEVNEAGVGYVEWFKTEEERENTIQKHNMVVVE